MNEYTCTVCGRVCVYLSREPELNVGCNCSEGPTKQLKGRHEVGDKSKRGTKSEIMQPLPTGPLSQKPNAPVIDNQPKPKIIQPTNGIDVKPLNKKA